MDFKQLLEQRKKHADENALVWEHQARQANADYSSSLYDPMKNVNYAKRLLDEAIRPFSTREAHADAVDDEDDDNYEDSSVPVSNDSYDYEATNTTEIIESLDDLQTEFKPQAEELPMFAGDWQALYDDNYSAFYFYNSVSGETVWEPPAEMVALGWSLPNVEEETAQPEAVQPVTSHAPSVTASYAASVPSSTPAAPAVTASSGQRSVDGVNEEMIERMSLESRAALKNHLKDLFLVTLQKYTDGQEVVKVGSNGRKYVRTVQLMGRFLVLSSKSVPKSIHISLIEEVRLGMASLDFEKLLKDIPMKKIAELTPHPDHCCSLVIKERDVSLIFPSLETRDAFVFMIRILRRQAANATMQALKKQ